jgi:tetratricopeptide (TPR) repeat protein
MDRIFNWANHHATMFKRCGSRCFTERYDHTYQGQLSASRVRESQRLAGTTAALYLGGWATWVIFLCVTINGCTLLNPSSPHQTPQPSTSVNLPEVTKSTTPLPAPAPLPEVKPSPVPSTQKPALAPIVVHAFTLTPALQSLVNEANSQASTGQLDLAAATLDRAVRIEPRNPLLWIELARVRLLENDGPQAEALSRKALVLARSDPKAHADAQSVLDSALKLTHPP